MKFNKLYLLKVHVDIKIEHDCVIKHIMFSFFHTVSEANGAKAQTEKKQKTTTPISHNRGKILTNWGVMRSCIAMSPSPI